jgi:hypothetical protein
MGSWLSGTASTETDGTSAGNPTRATPPPTNLSKAPVHFYIEGFQRPFHASMNDVENNTHRRKHPVLSWETLTRDYYVMDATCDFQKGNSRLYLQKPQIPEYIWLCKHKTDRKDPIRVVIAQFLLENYFSNKDSQPEMRARTVRALCHAYKNSLHYWKDIARAEQLYKGVIQMSEKEKLALEYHKNEEQLEQLKRRRDVLFKELHGKSAKSHGERQRMMEHSCRKEQEHDVDNSDED